MTSQLIAQRYRVLNDLGEGGFGKTYLVEDTQLPSRRHCVLKELILLETNPQIYELVKERFQREAVILERLGENYSQIPKLYAYFCEEQRFYLVQEYIQGATLAQTIASQGVMSELDVRNVMLGILPVLNHIHRQGIIHRDIKPENIILRQINREPVLIDFGAVREMIKTALHGETSAASIVVGTPGFMAGEQSIGRPVFSSDLYSLGLTAIYLLTGKLPQEFGTDPLTGRIMWQSFIPALSQDLAAILECAIQPNASDRFQTGAQMLAKLQPSATHSTTVLSNPISNQATVAVLPKASPANFDAPPSTGAGNWAKAMITAGLLGSLGLGALAITRSPQPQAVEIPRTYPQLKPTVKVESTPIAAVPQVPAVLPITPTPQPSVLTVPKTSNPSMGWIRLGTLPGTSGGSVGQSMIVSRQPITVNPPVIPAIGNAVQTSTNINLRDSFPAHPNYKLGAKLGGIPSNQRLKISKLEFVVDPVNPSETAVWAEVATPD
jgi:serine/threonine protein kinase, bacterial